MLRKRLVFVERLKATEKWQRALLRFKINRSANQPLKIRRTEHTKTPLCAHTLPVDQFPVLLGCDAADRDEVANYVVGVTAMRVVGLVARQLCHLNTSERYSIGRLLAEGFATSIAW
jgi:hypothetical protein